MIDIPSAVGTSAVRRAEAARLDALADRMEAESAALGDDLDGVRAGIGDDVWRGPAATRLAETVAAARGRLAAEASALSGVARRLRCRADDLRAEARRIDAAAEQARHELERSRRTALGAGTG